MNKKILLKHVLLSLALGSVCAFSNATTTLAANALGPSVAPAETIDVAKLSQAWDKTFPENKKVSHQKVTFHNRFGITLVADMYVPKNAPKGEKMAAIAVAGPYGAVKEQVSGRYAQELAARGFLTIAFDPAFTGESGGAPRNLTSPDLNTEDFSAAVDYLSNLDNVAADKIGIVGICGWGGFALNAAAMDPRIKATVISTMYDMSRVSANGYFDYTKTPEQVKAERMAARKAISAQRTADYKNGNYKMAGGVPVELNSDMPQFVVDYHNYYQEKLGHHDRSFGSTTGATLSSVLSFMNMPLLSYADEIENPVLMIHGEKAHSVYFSKDAFKKLKGDNKELLIIPDAVHTDLYYKMDVIPFAKIESFFKNNLK